MRAATVVVTSGARDDATQKHREYISPPRFLPFVRARIPRAFITDISEQL